MLCSFCGSTSGNPGFCTNCGKNLTTSAPIKGPTEAGLPIIIGDSVTDVRQTTGTTVTTEKTDNRDPQHRVRGRDPRKRGRVVPLLVLSLGALLFIGGSSAALWWLFAGASNNEASSPDTRVAPGDYGSNPELDQMWDECAEGTFQSCDDLYFTSEPDSEYERFGASCGDRAEAPGSCSLLGGISDPAEDGAFGSDLALDLLWTECEGGNMTACEDLYLGSPVGSEYEEFGATCGGKADANGNCASRFP